MIIGVLVLLGIVLFQLGDIKELVKRNYKRARRLVVGSRPPKAAEIRSSTRRARTSASPPRDGR